MQIHHLVVLGASIDLRRHKMCIKDSEQQVFPFSSHAMLETIRTEGGTLVDISFLIFAHMDTFLRTAFNPFLQQCCGSVSIESICLHIFRHQFLGNKMSYKAKIPNPRLIPQCINSHS